MLKENGGLESILSFLKDETFVKKNLESVTKTFCREKERLLKLLIANVSSLSQVKDQRLRESFSQKSQDLIELMFKMIKNNKDITSDLAFSVYLFLSKSCNHEQIENVFCAIPKEIKDYLKKCVDDFNKTNQNDLVKKREKRDLIIGRKKYKNQQFYALDIDKSGISTTLNVILESLAHLASKNEHINSLIYTELKDHLDIVLEKGSTGEKRLVLEIYKQLACDQEIRKEFILSEEIKTSILKSDDYEEILENGYKFLLILLGQNCETKESVSHDGPRNKSDLILLVFNWTNEEQFGELEKKLEKLDYRVKLIDIEGM
jgi:hypothetical protein